MIGVVVVGSLRSTDWDWKLLYRIGAKTIFEHTVEGVSEVEHAHKIILCLDYKDSSVVSGTAFNTPAFSMAALHSDRRITIMYSDKGERYHKAYDACVAHGIDIACIIDADCPLIPPWLIKNCILQSATRAQPVRTSGFHNGIYVEVMPFHVLSNIYRYRDHQDLREKYISEINYYEIKNIEGTDNYIYGSSIDISTNKRNMPMIEALLHDAARGADLSDLLRDWDEQKRDI